MINMYTEMTACLDMLDHTLMDLIQENLGDVRAKIKNHKERLKSDKHFILVAGIVTSKLTDLHILLVNKTFTYVS